MPHPPVLVSDVGRGREKEAKASLAGLAGIVERLKDMKDKGRPDCLLILSPHQPYVDGAIYFNTAGVVKGGLGRFGAPHISFLLTRTPYLEDLASFLMTRGLVVTGGVMDKLGSDHGTLVPLHFLSPCFDDMPPVILANPIGLSPEKALDLGRALADFDTGGQRWALLASGDLSHRLLPEGPGGFDPQGPLFDQDVVRALNEGSVKDLLADWPQERLIRAGECGYRSALTLLGLIDGPAEVLSYEGPFGVGYCNALWINPAA